MRKAFGAFVVASMVLAGVALPGPFGASGSAEAFCNPGRSGLDGTPSAGIFPATGFPNNGGAGPWNATEFDQELHMPNNPEVRSSASAGRSAVLMTCGDDYIPGPHTPD